MFKYCSQNNFEKDYQKNKLELLPHQCMATLLLMNRNRGIFTNETFTYYRQYNNNTSGVSDFSKKSIINDFNTKINHYKYFNSLKLDNKKKILILKEKLEKIKKDKNYFKTFLGIKNIKNFGGPTK